MSYLEITWLINEERMKDQKYSSFADSNELTTDLAIKQQWQLTSQWKETQK